MTRQRIRRALEVGSVLLFIAVMAIAGITAGQGHRADASENDYICSSYPYPACGCSGGYLGQDDYPGYPGYPSYPGYPTDCFQFIPSVMLPYP